jgi:dipeptidyl aminopeptidase/acylaminoacyl peptidase
MDPGSGTVDYALSAQGTLVYVPERATNRVVWVDRLGVTKPLLDDSKVYLTPSLSPDERRLAVAVFDPSMTRRSLWLSDLERGTLTGLTFGDVDATDPIWSPDGTRIGYAQRSDSTTLNVFVKNVDGTDEPIQLTDVLNTTITSWSPDGESIVLQGAAGTLSYDVSIVDVGAGNSVKPLIAAAKSGVLSPDGRWLSYTSLVSGRSEVYVSSYPALHQKFLVSTDGGVGPRWSGNSRELFYRNGEKMMAVDIHAEAEFSASKPILLFKGRFATDPVGGDATNYDVTADGQRFVMIREDVRARQLRVVFNCFEELKRLVPHEN